MIRRSAMVVGLVGHGRTAPSGIEIVDKTDDRRVAYCDAVANEPGVTTSAANLLMKAGMLIGRAIDDALVPLGISGRQFFLLSIAVEHHSDSQLEISRRMHLDPTIVVSLVDELEQAGFVERRRHPDDRRRYQIALTAAGRKVHRSAIRAAAGVERSFLGELSAAERERLRGDLERVMAAKLGA